MFNTNHLYITTVLFISLIIYCYCVEEGTVCITTNLDGGVCKLLDHCPSAVDDLKLKIYPTNCGFDGNDPIVCCPKIGEIARKQCKYYLGLKPQFVVGGNDAEVNEFPHMAALGFGNTSDIKWQCGGSLISEKHILTAAHCLRSPLGEVTYAKLGTINIHDEGVQVKIVKKIPHPLYKPPSVYHDIAILELEKNVIRPLDIHPACIYTKYEIETKDISLIAAGWGLTQYGGSQSHILQKVDLELFTHQECNDTYKISRRYARGIDFNRQVCAGSKSQNKDTCQGDSGGPLQFYDDSTYMDTIVGVTSFGKACGTINLPGIYTKVSYYVPWIEKTVWSEEY